MHNCEKMLLMCVHSFVLEHLLSIIETWSYNTVSLEAWFLKLLKICLAWLDLDFRAPTHLPVNPVLHCMYCLVQHHKCC